MYEDDPDQSRHSASVWNSLPVDIRQLSGNPEQFKNKLKTVLFL